MDHFTSIEAFASALPALCLERQAGLKGHDGSFCIVTGDGAPWHIVLKDGSATVDREMDPQADCTIQAGEQVLLDMIQGKLNPVKALLFRKVTVHGDLGKLKDLISALS